MATKLVLTIKANEGYSAGQVRGRVTVGDLKRYLEDTPDDAEIITYDQNNERGASWGILTDYHEEEDVEDDDCNRFPWER